MKEVGEFLGVRVVTSKGMPDDKVAMVSFDPASPAGDTDAAVVASLKLDGTWHVSNILHGQDARNAIKAAIAEQDGALEKERKEE